MEREELLRISVGSLADWEHIKNDLRADALALFRDTLDSEDVQPSERTAVLADFNNFLDDTFSMAEPNLRVNGHNFEKMNNTGQDMEAFDEALDRRIWSLADTRLQWHKRTTRMRREAPEEIQARLSSHLDRLVKAYHQPIPDMPDQEDEVPDRQSPVVSTEVAEEFHKTSAVVRELGQGMPSQQQRVSLAEKATGELKSMKC
ncbi:hypothetical protein Agabi119p4_3511 [Agaricus bisporus var. burnettii]|uniref:Uncharacterized protein n=1 Tax=Agaricus bisporus var. burnettii TaxID=192524 RepID=A0A8H7F4Y8_AGABI|nr:hypothetical protein Agabi119p4_3511 [Agaricus bisporus var. burnettii]